MLQSESVKNLLSQLVDAQAEFPSIAKDCTINMGKFSYKYANLDNITMQLRPILHKHGLAFIQSVGGLEPGHMTITTRVFNKDGEYIEDTALLPPVSGQNANAAQTLGMSITYMRRYMLCAMLGITSDEDTDANPNTHMDAKPNTQKVQQKTAAPNPAEPKGGPDTPEQKKMIVDLLRAKDLNGKPVFSPNEGRNIDGLRLTKTADEVIAGLKEQVRLARMNSMEPSDFPDDKPWATAPTAEEQQQSDLF